MARPDIRISFKSFNTGKYYDAGAIWLSDKGGTLKPQEKTDKEAQYPSIALARACELVLQDKGRLYLQTTQKGMKIFVGDDTFKPDELIDNAFGNGGSSFSDEDDL